MSQDGHRPLVGFLTAIGVLALLAVLATQCRAHPVGAARTFGKYESKATTTAEGALSNVATTQLTARTASDGKAFGPYVSLVVSDAEEAISKVQGTFDSIQPPNERADRLQSDLDELLSDALDHVRDVRVAARRGELSGLQDTARPLIEDAKNLEDFVERHK